MTWAVTSVDGARLSGRERGLARVVCLDEAAAPVAKLWRTMSADETTAWRRTMEADLHALWGDEPPPPPEPPARRVLGAMGALNRSLERAARRQQPARTELVIDLTEPQPEPAPPAPGTGPRCERHSFEFSTATCSRCQRGFCEDCMVRPLGTEHPPLCVSCALVAAGIRPNA